MLEADKGTDVSDWWADLCANWLPTDPPPKPSKRGGLAAKRDVVASLKPTSICEIGVRAGYSAFAMLTAAPDARFLGIDLGTAYYGEPEPIRAHAIELLSRFPNVTLLWADSHNIKEFSPFDLVHVDGDHSILGAGDDLWLARRSGCRWALVDDVDHIPAVRSSVEWFAKRHGLAVEFIDDGHHGTALVDLGA